ncbi:hypothetical protein Q2T41_06490 [Maribacter confluentis]|uniref:DUF975 family protein n=1 Tax=Maribacter confluentis TaxID=1656093 RepID=A0ABT8RN56_9FLAO|nr:hypothetical protein [Maribacter confluentis]MDO1512301.1 hypothetical protein [Maribacter confluentis]
MNLEKKITEIKSRPNLEFGSIFNRSIELFKKIWVQGFIALLLTFLTILPFYIILYIPMIATGITDPYALEHNELPPMVAVAMGILSPIVIIGVSTFSLAINAAFLRICRQKDEEKDGVDDYFYFFRDGRIGKVFILALYIMGVALLGMLACGVGLFYVIVPLSLLPAFLAFSNELSAFGMVKASFILGNKNWLIIFLLVLVAGIVAELGLLLCCVGIFFTAMFSKVPTYFMYKDGVGFVEDAYLN